jgi:transcriptional regulator with GAF, ATPase, and Fis domain
MGNKDKTIENFKLQHALINIFKVSLSNKPIMELVKTSHKELIKLMGKDKTNNFYLAMYEGNYMYLLPYYEDEHDKDPINKPISLKGGLTDYIRRKRTTELIDRKRHKELIENGEADLIGIGTDSFEWIGAPLEYHNKIHGVLVVQTYNKKIKYTKEDVELIAYVSKNLAQAIDRKKRDAELREYRKKLENDIQEKSKEIVEKNKKLIESRKMEAIGILSAGIIKKLKQVVNVQVILLKS